MHALMPASSPLSLIVFADPNQLASAQLARALVATLATRTDMALVRLYLTQPPLPAAERRRVRWRRRWQAMLGTGRLDAGYRRLARDPLAGLAERGIPLECLPDGDPQHPAVLARLDRLAGPAVAVNLYCLRRFGPPLLDRLAAAVNYHNGHLPAFRGLRASNWSLYLGEARSGYTFHYMDAGWDTGPVLLADQVDCHPGDTAADLEARKAAAAARRLPELLDRLARRDPGTPQSGPGRHFSRADLRALQDIPHPETLTHAEWQRRLAAFQVLHVQLDGRRLPVTRLAPAPGPGRHAFHTADGVWLRVTGLDFWPHWGWHLAARWSQRWKSP